MGLFSHVIFNFSNGIKYCNFGDTILNIAFDYHHGQELRQEDAMLLQVIFFSNGIKFRNHSEIQFKPIQK